PARAPAATTARSPLSLHDALPIWTTGPIDAGERDPQGAPRSEAAGVAGLPCGGVAQCPPRGAAEGAADPAGPTLPCRAGAAGGLDRKSTRLNSSHVKISYAVFCLK